MKQLKCEMCGSTDIMKQDGIFICQNCGIKYSAEEAKKMMIDGVVNVKVSRDEDFARIKKLADDAFDNGLWIDAGKYYTQLAEIHDLDYESAFRCLMAKANSRYRKFPPTEKSIKLVLNAFHNYKENLMSDKNIDSARKELIISDFFWDIDSLIWWLFKRDKDKHIKTDQLGNEETIYYRCDYEEIIKILESCLDLYTKLFECMNDELDACPFIEKQFEIILKQGLKLLTWYDCEYDRPCYSTKDRFGETFYPYTGEKFDRFLSPTQKQRANKFKDTIEQYKNLINAKYWDKHPEEKKKLDEEKNDINKKIEKLKRSERDKISEIESQSEIQKAKKINEYSAQQEKKLSQNIDNISRLNKEMNNLNVLQFIKKRKITQKIDEMNINNTIIREDITSHKDLIINNTEREKEDKIKDVHCGIEKEIKLLKERLNDIENKLKRNDNSKGEES